MRALPHLEASVYVEGAQGAAVPLFGVGTPLPAVRRHTLPAPQAQQVSLAVHVLYGSAALAADNDSLGKWLVEGPLPAGSDTGRLRIQFTVDAAGSLDLVAVQGDSPLAVTSPPGPRQRLPVDPAGIEPPALAEAWARLRVEEESPIREDLALLLQAEPDNLAGWALLAALILDPLHKAGCYRQVLRLDPGNLAAMAVLRAIPAAGPATARATAGPAPLPSLRQDGTLICPRCGAVMELRDAESEGRRAFCPGCGATVDLPASFAAARSPLPTAAPAQPRPSTAGPGLTGMRLEARAQAQTRSANDDEDALIADLVRSQPARRESPSSAGGSLFSRLARRLGQEQAVRASPSPAKAPAAPDQDPLDPELVLELAGGPLSAEERVRCPGCEATVSRDQDKCPWCSASLS